MNARVFNRQKELLETIVEGADVNRASNIIVFVHGFGTNLHERGLFDDIVGALTKQDTNLSTVRFSWSGFGESGGKQEDTTLQKVSGDFGSVLDWVFTNKQTFADVTVVGFSMGNIITSSVLVSEGHKVRKVININPADFKSGSESFQKWLTYPGAKLDNDIVVIPRSDGTVTRINRKFWDTMDDLNYEDGLKNVVSRFASTLIRATDDNIVDNSELKRIDFSNIIELPGDHSFSGKDNRNVFLDTLKDLFVEKNTIVDENDSVIGAKARSEITTDDIYRVAGLWIENNNQVLLAKRSNNKSQNPDRWMPVVVSGTVAEGESYDESIVRETMEEIGVDLASKGFELIQKKLVNTKYNFYAAIFKPKLPILLEEIKFDINETSELKWFNKDELKAEIAETPDAFVPEMGQVTDGLL